MSDKVFTDLEIIIHKETPDWIGVATEGGYIGYSIKSDGKASQFSNANLEHSKNHVVIGTLDELLHLIRTKYNANS